MDQRQFAGLEMKNYRSTFKDFSIHVKVTIILMLFAGLSLITIAGIFYYQNVQKKDALVVDVAGRQRMLSQRIAFLAERLVLRNDARIRASLVEAINLANTSLIVLRLGGVIPGTSEKRLIPPSSSFVLPTLLNAEELWKQYKTKAEMIVQISSDTDQYRLGKNKLQKALSFIEYNADEMLKRFNMTVQMYVEENRQKQERIWVWGFLVGIIGLNALLILGARFIFLKTVTRPILQIKNNSLALAQGDLNTSFQYKSKDEIGQAIQALDIFKANLQAASYFAQEIGNRQFDGAFKSLSERDTLGLSLLSMRDQLRKVAQEDQKRHWLNEGLTKGNEILRLEQHDLKSVSQSLIAFMTKYIQAQQGAFFLHRTDRSQEGCLEALAVYAWGRKKFVRQKIGLDEGLTGQAFQEGTTIYVEEIPADYVHIKSGLGATAPFCILLVPLKMNEQILGVLEMAALQEIQDHEIQFIEKLASDISVSIASILNNVHTSQLLDESQQLTKELQAQEEEIKQNLEELEATKEDLVRKEKKYLHRIELLENQLAEQKDS